MSLGEADQLYRDLHHSEQRVTLFATYFEVSTAHLEILCQNDYPSSSQSESPPNTLMARWTW